MNLRNTHGSKQLSVNQKVTKTDIIEILKISFVFLVNYIILGLPFVSFVSVKFFDLPLFSFTFLMNKDLHPYIY